MKVTGLLALTAVALAGLAGASTASASILCEKNETSSCTEPQKAGASLKLSIKNGTSSSLTSTAWEAVNTCTEGTASGTISNPGSETEPVTASFGAGGVTWGGCTGETTTITGGELVLHRIAGSDNATVTAKDFAVKMKTAVGTCHYGAGTGTDLGTLTVDTVNGTDATLDVNTVLNKVASHSNDVFCPSTARWTGTFTQTSTTPIRAVASSVAVVPNPSILCEKNETSSCTEPQKAGASLKLSIKNGTSSSLTSTAWEAVNTCTEGTASGTISNPGSETEPVTASFGAGGVTWGGCTGETTTITGGELVLHRIAGSDNATVTAKDFAVKMKTAVGTCHYGAGTGTDLGTLTVDTVNGTDATLDVNTVLNKVASHSNDVFCPSTARWTGTFTQTSTTPIRAVASS